MASKEIMCLETDKRRIKELDVFTIYSIFHVFICHLQTVLGTRSITNILDYLVKQEHFRLAEFLTTVYSGYIQAISGGCKRDLKRTGKLWLSFKMLVDSKKDKLFSPCFDILSDAFRTEMMDGKQEAVDRFVICTWFQVQQYEKDQCEKRKSILNNMVAAIPNKFDSIVAEIVYYSKMATTSEFENDIESAKDFASKAKYLSEICEDKTAKILAHYSYYFLHRRLYLRDKSDTNQQIVLEQCDIGCDMFPVPDEDSDFEMYCALLFLLYKAGDYLHITYELEVLDSVKMSPANIMAAEEVLRSAYRYIPISTPRKMLTFKFCMGRLYHLRSEFEKASTYLKETKELMKGGVLNEKEQRNVYRYCEKFDEEHRWKSCLAQDNETAKETAEALIVKQHYCLRQNMLHSILEKIGRKNEVTLRLCEDVCSYIKGKNDKIVHVFPSYTIHSDREVVFVIFVKDLLSKQEEDELGYTIKQRLVDQFSPEGKVVMSNETASGDALTLDETKRLKDCINMHATDLMQRHKYLSIITASSLRSRGYGTDEFMIQKEPCIVLYVHTKGYIPLAEDPFKKSFDGVPVDVREGMFETYPVSNIPTANEYHGQLRMGCDIGVAPNNRGTLGGFIEHPQYGICGLTCAHVFLNPGPFEDLKANGGRMHWPEFYPLETVYQPGDSDNQIGQLVQAVYLEGGKDNIGVEVALFQIEQRAPVEGEFPSTLNEADGEKLRFNSGKTYGLSRINKWPVVKFGRSTDKTSGVFIWNQTLSSVKTVKHEWDYAECKITLHNQLEIQSVPSNTKFANFGDSGSLVFMKDETGEYVCVGMVEGGTSNETVIVTPITPILEQFNVVKLKSFKETIFERNVLNTFQVFRNELSEIKSGIANLLQGQPIGPGKQCN